MILARLGTGASGIVYAARDSHGSDVALKVLRPELADIPQVRERLRREADALRRVSSPRTVKVLDVDVEGLTPFLAMELVSGQALDQFIATNGPMKGAILMSLFDALVESLIAIHEVGITHRDLKPSNILIGRDGIKVADFGISTLSDQASLTQTGMVMGTASWLSPEQVNGEAVGPSSDVFNLGLIVAYAASGVHPFGEGRSDALMYRITHDEPNVASLPRYLQGIIKQCLLRNPIDRPDLVKLSAATKIVSGDLTPSPVGDFSPNTSEGTRIVDSGALQAAIASSAWSPPPDMVGTHRPQWVGAGSPRTPKSRRIVGIAVAGVLAVVVGAVVFLTSKESDEPTVSAASDGSTVTTVLDGAAALYQDEFESILILIEKLERVNETFYLDHIAAKDAFFLAAPDGNTGFWNYVRSDGPNWLSQYRTIWDTFYGSENLLANTLRSKAIAIVEGRENLLEVRAAALAHYDTWIRYAEKYEDAVKDYVHDTDDSWNVISARNHELLLDQIGETFLKLCGLLGDKQPIGGSVDYSARIANACES